MIIKVNIFLIRKNGNNRSFFFLLAPFIPKQPNEILKAGDIYLKSIDKNHRRSYDKFIANDNSEGDNNIQQLYVRDFVSS